MVDDGRRDGDVCVEVPNMSTRRDRAIPGGLLQPLPPSQRTTGECFHGLHHMLSEVGWMWEYYSRGGQILKVWNIKPTSPEVTAHETVKKRLEQANLVWTSLDKTTKDEEVGRRENTTRRVQGWGSR